MEPGAYNIRNVQQDLGADKVEVVAYGPGIGRLKLDAAVAPRVAEALQQGVKVMACENTLSAHNKLTRSDMPPNIGYATPGSWR